MRGIEIGDLSGITLLHSPDTLDYGPDIAQFDKDSPTPKRIEIFQTAERRTMDLARTCGATVLCMEKDQELPTGDGVYWQNRDYPTSCDIVQEFESTHHELLGSMPRYALDDSDQGLGAAYARLRD